MCSTKAGLVLLINRTERIYIVTNGLHIEIMLIDLHIIYMHDLNMMEMSPEKTKMIVV